MCHCPEIWLRRRLTVPFLCLFSAVAVALTIAAFLTPDARSPALQFFAREQPALVSVPLALGTLWLWRNPDRWRAAPIRPAGYILLVLALATSAVQVATSRYWGDYIDAYRAVLGGTAGIVPWERMFHGLRLAEQECLRG